MGIIFWFLNVWFTIDLVSYIFKSGTLTSVTHKSYFLIFKRLVQYCIIFLYLNFSFASALFYEVLTSGPQMHYFMISELLLHKCIIFWHLHSGSNVRYSLTTDKYIIIWCYNFWFTRELCSDILTYVTQLLSFLIS